VEKSRVRKGSSRESAGVDDPGSCRNHYAAHNFFRNFNPDRHGSELVEKVYLRNCARCSLDCHVRPGDRLRAAPEGNGGQVGKVEIVVLRNVKEGDDGCSELGNLLCVHPPACSCRWIPEVLRVNLRGKYRSHALHR